MIHLIGVAFVLGLLINHNQCDAAQSSVTALYGDGYVTGEESRTSLRFDTLAVKEWGVAYGRADFVSPVSGEYSGVSVRGIAHLGRGLHLGTQIQGQKEVSNTSLGVGYSDFSKDLSWFVDVYRMNSSYYGDSSHLFAYLSKQWDRVKLGGFLEVTQPDNTFQPVTFSQMALSYKLGEISVGVEHQRVFNKLGVKGLDESVNQLMVKWEF
jgi:hypothetical protein